MSMIFLSVAEGALRLLAAAMGRHGHPFLPAELQLPWFMPQRLLQGQIVAPFVGTAVLAILGAWLVSGAEENREREATRSCSIHHPPIAISVTVVAEGCFSQVGRVVDIIQNPTFLCR